MCKQRLFGSALHSNSPRLNLLKLLRFNPNRMLFIATCSSPPGKLLPYASEFRTFARAGQLLFAYSLAMALLSKEDSDRRSPTRCLNPVNCSGEVGILRANPLVKTNKLLLQSRWKWFVSRKAQAVRRCSNRSPRPGFSRRIQLCEPQLAIELKRQYHHLRSSRVSFIRKHDGVRYSKKAYATPSELWFLAGLRKPEDCLAPYFKTIVLQTRPSTSARMLDCGRGIPRAKRITAHDRKYALKTGNERV